MYDVIIIIYLKFTIMGILCPYFSSFYTYDASAQYLIQVTVDGDSVQYDYNEDGDLIRVLYATGEQTSFRYNANSFLSSVATYTEKEDLLSSMEFLYHWNGRVQMTIMPENKTTNAFFDTSGEILHVTTNDSTPFTQVNEPELGRKLIRSGSQVHSLFVVVVHFASYVLNIQYYVMEISVGDNENCTYSTLD